MSSLDAARRVLAERFGFDGFRPGQGEVIAHLLAGRSAAAVFPTGGGKSLCYQLPALILPGVTIVVSPLIALMKDQIDALGARGVAARRLDSSLPAHEHARAMDEVRDGRTKLLYVAPERFFNERFRDAIGRVRVSLFAIDEAHCISEWGHNFRPDYLKLARVARALAAERVLALTATATARVLADVCRELAIDPSCAVRTGFHRENLTLLATALPAASREAALIERLRDRPPGPTIVYVTLQRTAEQLAKRLGEAGFEARAYHAGMEDEVRAEVQEWFMASGGAVVVATIAFGMGIDKKDIRYVYHANPPKSLESYSQEIGRAGRDGAPAICEMLACGADWNALESFAYGDTPGAGAVRSLLGELFARAGDPGDATPSRRDGDDDGGGSDPTITVALHELSSKHDIRLLVVKTLLTYLELEGLLDATTPFFATYRVKLLAGEDEIVRAFDAERARFLRAVFAQCERGRTWLTLDPARAAELLGEPRARIRRAIDYLESKGRIEVEPKDVRHRYRVRRAPADLDALARSLHGRLVAREASELERLAQVKALIALEGCRTSALGAHFGEPLAEPCHRCTFCLAGAGEGAKAALALVRRHLETPPASIDDRIWERAERLRRSRPDVLGDPRAFARLLCGVTSPALTRARITRGPGSDGLFGALADVPFGDVLARAEASRAGEARRA